MAVASQSSNVLVAGFGHKTVPGSRKENQSGREGDRYQVPLSGLRVIDFPSDVAPIRSADGIELREWPGG